MDNKKPINIEKPKRFGHSLGRLLKYLKKYWAGIIVSFVLAIIGVLASLLGPKVLQIIMEEIVSATNNQVAINFARVGTIAGILIGLFFVSGFLQFVQYNILAVITARVSKKMRGDISSKINRLPLAYFDKRSYGDVLSCITNDIDTIGQTLNQSLSNILSSVIMLTGLIVMMFVTSWELTLITLAMTPITIILLAIIVKFSQKFFREQQNSLGAINGHVEEIFSAHSVVKVYGGKSKALDKFDNINGRLYRSGYLSQFLSGLMQPIMMFVANLMVVVVAIVGIIMATKNPIFIATLVIFVIYVKNLNHPISQLASITSTLQSTAAAAERVFDLLEADEQSEDIAPRGSINLASITGKILFENVAFGYTEEREIIHDFNLSVNPGEQIAIVGPTGAGKTTLVNLLMRFYELGKGSIKVDGISLADMNRHDVRSIFGMVLQDTWLFNGTIRENLKFGKDITDEEMFKVTKACKIDHFIKALPNGYDMVLDENSNISQGQKQLFTIARAMLENAPVLILDEATSSVDTRTELLIQEAMDKLTEDRTSFVIAHRLSTIKNASKILVMRDGNIVEIGTHKELLEKGGFYSELYNSQFAE